MRLLKINTDGRLSLTENLDDNNLPPYATLSHTWREDGDEVTFVDFNAGAGKSRAGYVKLEFCQSQAKRDGLEYFWIDTCCIDKRSSAELSEALNSMFRWYEKAKHCYVYLSDVSSRKRDSDGKSGQPLWEAAFRRSRWFTRGWTLQELLAPEIVEFYSREEELLGTKKKLCGLLSEITGIPLSALQGTPLSKFSIPERYRWAADRKTKKVEDQAYCLFGIFGVHLPPIYGEGKNCWHRLENDLGVSLHTESSGGSTLIIAEPSGLVDRRSDLMATLSFTQMNSRMRTIKRAYSTTCTWFLKHPAYTAWLDRSQLQEHQGFLWISGKPGAGKSTLMKFLHAHADKSKSTKDLVISFFFNARGEAMEKSTVGMFRSLLHQLFSEYPRLQEALNDPRLSFDSSDIDTLQDLFSVAVAKLENTRLFCFVDALDECDEQQVRQMVSFWEDIGEQAVDREAEIYTCFASRPYPTIDIRHGCQVTLELEDGHGDDLAKYVRSHLRTGKSKSKYLDEVRQRIQEMANGVFMWVVLVVEILNEEIRRGYMHALKKRLSDIPPELGELFRKILRRDGAKMDDMLLCLQWILFAREPLTREEFYFAMLSGNDSAPEHLDKWDPDYISVEDMTQLILNASKGLAELTKGKSPTVQFIHESVRDFLLKENGLRELWPELDGQVVSFSHDKLKKCCANYLAANWERCYPTDSAIPKASSEAGKDLQGRMSREYPFLEYASHQVLYHADVAAEQISQVAFLKEFDLKSLIYAANLLERYDNHRHSPEASLMYILAENNCAGLIQIARHSGWSSNVEGERYRYPLMAAVANGSREAFRALLQSEDEELAGEDITGGIKFGREFYYSKHRTPLLWALQNGNKPVAIRILHARAQGNIHATNREGRNALSLVAEKGYDEIASHLLAAGLTDEGSKDMRSRRPLSYAAQYGHTDIVRMLLEYDEAGPNTVGLEDNYGRQPLSYAAQHGHTDIVRMLLEHDQAGLNTVNSQDDGLRGPLSYAAQNRRTDIVRMLLEQGAEADATDEDGRCAVHWTIGYDSDLEVSQPLHEHGASNSDLEVLRLLYEHGADINAKAACEGHTPLHYCSLKGSASAAQLLIEMGAEIEAKDARGRTPLHTAAESGMQDIIQVLLRSGAGAHGRDEDGWTAVWLAASHGHSAALDAMLQAGADFDRINDFGQTALARAAGVSHCAVELLLLYGVSIDVTDSVGQTALMRSARGDMCIELKRLIDQGAKLNLQDEAGRTALSLAVEERADSAVSTLCESGACLETVDKDGDTPLLQALPRFGKFGSLHAARAHIGDREGLWRRRMNIMRILLAAGARVDVIGSDGKTVLQRAIEYGFENAQNLLEEYSAKETRVGSEGYLDGPRL